MNVITIGKYHCNTCNKDRAVNLYTEHHQSSDNFNWSDAVDYAQNSHWYEFHYNCAICGGWIPSGERELLRADDFVAPLHPNYSTEHMSSGLLRAHKNCLLKINNKK